MWQICVFLMAVGFFGGLDPAGVAGGAENGPLFFVGNPQGRRV
jgi:hypothetical protein